MSGESRLIRFFVGGLERLVIVIGVMSILVALAAGIFVAVSGSSPFDGYEMHGQMDPVERAVAGFGIFCAGLVGTMLACGPVLALTGIWRNTRRMVELIETTPVD